MQVAATTSLPADTDVDTVAVAVFDGEEIAHDTPGKALQSLLDSGEARTKPRALALAHAGGKRWLLVGMGSREKFTAETARAAAAVAQGRIAELGATALCWELPHHVGPEIAEALVEGTLLAAYRFERYHAQDEDSPPPPQLERLLVSGHDDLSEAVERARIVSEAVCAARDLQNTPSNDMTPAALATRARALADEIDGLTVEVEGRDGLLARKMGSFAAVAQGSDEEPALITMRYHGPGASGPVLGLVGKAVTFDTGGISLKPGLKMSEMKFDMSGGATVVEAVGAIARLALPVSIVAVVGATENMPSGHAVKPGDIVRASNGVTIEVNNTDAEGRLVLADCLVHARALGAERLVDLATLTGAILVTLGHTHAGLMSNDDDWAAQVTAAGETTGEITWRLPLHSEYADAVKGQYGDLNNAPEDRLAGSIVAAEFLHRFAEDTPWVHLDIAGTAWGMKRPYAAKGGSGFGVRLLVQLARTLA
ncbi:MAG TPA: leucyl aminopeptidase [Solirubrobacteraceae bacterium]|nr:leucyl aminopeptidase [Solirubrobacteraceae bacterium]